MEARRHQYTRVCVLGAHEKCLGFYEHPIRGRVSCDCDCHTMMPTLFTDPEREAER